MSDNVFYSPSRNSIIDFLRDDGRTKIGGNTLEETRAKYGADVIEMPWEEAHDRYQKAFIAPPVEISKERWTQMLMVLPPAKYTNAGHVETFYMPEHIAGAIVSWFVRIGDRYFELADSCRLNHIEVSTLCRPLLKPKQGEA